MKRGGFLLLASIDFFTTARDETAASGTWRIDATLPFNTSPPSPREIMIPVILSFRTISPLKKFCDYCKEKSQPVIHRRKIFIEESVMPWYAVHTRSRHEDRVYAGLVQKSIYAFL